MYKLSLSISDSCPNRDGTCGRGGCIFCAGGSGDFAADYKKGIVQQIEEAKKRVEAKNRGGKYIAYFQSYTSTYIEPEKLKRCIDEAAALPYISALSVATRADCLDDKIMTILGAAAAKMPLTVELGLQTSSDKTAAIINRCCPLEKFESAIHNIKKIGAQCVLHMIIGLPGEGKADFFNTADFIAKSGADGVKLQLLHVLKGTELEKMYRDGKFSVLTPDEYFEAVAGIIERLPPDMVIHRLTGDGAKSRLVAPLWSADKKRVMNSLTAYLNEHDIIQGRCFEK